MATRDLRANHAMTWEFDQALDGNVALTGQLNAANDNQFTVAISFGETLSSATACLLQSLSGDFKTQRSKFVGGWEDAGRQVENLLKGSAATKAASSIPATTFILAHEDKTYQGAFIASIATHGARRGTTKKARADTISSGRATWCKAQWACWPPGTWRRPHECWSIWRRGRKKTEVFRRTSG